VRHARDEADLLVEQTTQENIRTPFRSKVWMVSNPASRAPVSSIRHAPRQILLFAGSEYAPHLSCARRLADYCLERLADPGVDTGDSERTPRAVARHSKRSKNPWSF
jgi:hypothetical protein